MNQVADDEFDFLTGRGMDQPYPPAISLPGGGGKFTPDGKALSYPGNTFLCPLAPDTEAFEVLTALQGTLQKLPFAEHFIFLPPEGFHMTVFCGVSVDPLEAGGWPEDLSKGPSLEAMNTLFSAAIREVQGKRSFSLRARQLFGGYNLFLDPVDTAAHHDLWGLRSRLREATGIRRHNHDTYDFHITLGYRLRWMDDQTAAAHLSTVAGISAEFLATLGEIRLGPVQFCSFGSMLDFQSLGRLDCEGFHPAESFGTQADAFDC